ncbi:DUF3244 domain-containing protein [Cyclobacterium amurskyense]|uniref:Secretion system C-terminal sorting domain-containing protein n=1 Tax=Cyclobacterium amurskyense TaxID=320787 RepID=A0A0H4PE02_9BACT|nr:DUF3244 domain-containing protein [Cyclobacterium amurskyense]AKP51038.1 hypothetical protein CA2015_1602 [Cyclobacterium amurskyense]|tara:strand:- start:1668 stop:2234 length:567 start_codon:yes stop_codon:yes gene_type:complete
MKTITTLMLVFGLSFSSFAIDKGLMEVSSVEIQEQRFTINLAEAIGQVRISIYDPNGNIINRTFFKVSGPQRIPFNLSQVPEGHYKVMLETKDESRNFDIASYRKVEKKVMAYAKAIDENSFNLRVLGITEPNTKVTIYSDNHKVLLKDEITEMGGFSKNYHLKYLKLSKIYLKVENAEGKSKFLYFN